MRLNYKVIERVITEWDPMKIIIYVDELIINPDEYEPEINDIFDNCNYVKNGDINGLAKMIGNIFNKWFEIRLNNEECFKAAEEIYYESKCFTKPV